MRRERSTWLLTLKRVSAPLAMNYSGQTWGIIGVLVTVAIAAIPVLNRAPNVHDDSDHQPDLDTAMIESRGGVISELAKSDEQTEHPEENLAGQDDQTQEAEVEHADEQNRVRLNSYVASLPDKPVDCIVYFIDESGKQSNQASSFIADKLTLASGVQVIDDVFSEAFASAGGFGVMYKGKGADDLQSMGISRIANRLLLLRSKDVQKGNSKNVSGVHTHYALVDAALINAKTGKLMREWVIDDTTGAGVNEAKARLAFIERLADRISATDLLLD